jgi:DNA-binding MarR family transcriptional regulator
MTGRREAGEVASALRVGIGLVVRRLRQVQPDGGLSMPEASALALLDREGPTTSSVLAKREHITPQSMGVTLSALESRGLVQRRPDPDDGRRAVMSLTRAGRDAVLRRRDASTEAMARALAANFTAVELEQLRTAAALIERLAHAL